MSLFQELKRRNVFRIGVAYLVGSWVVLQIIDVVAPIFELPDWAPKLVLTLLAIGLLPALVFAWAFELTPEGVKREADVDRSNSVTNDTGRKLNAVIVGALVLAVVLLLVERQTKTATAPEAAESIAEAQEVRSIAVLPFVNMSSDEEQEFFSDGITEEILNALASVTELKVAGRTSSFAFKGQNDDLRRIGEALGVNHILEGSVRKAGDQVRITAQLIQVDNGFHVWSETYDKELIDVFAIQDEIANEILTQLKLRLLSDDVGASEADRTSPEVYALYLKAKQRIYKRTTLEIQTAITELDEAIGLDPSYAPAYAQRGIATMLMSNEQYGSLPNNEANRRGKRFAEEAVKLNPKLADGWAGLGLYSVNTVGFAEEGVTTLEKALELNPNHIDASNWLFIALRRLGETPRAIELLETVTERDPLYVPAFSNAISMFVAFGQQDRAEALIQRISKLDSNKYRIKFARSQVAVSEGRYGDALRLLEEMDAETPLTSVPSQWFSFALQGTGQFERAKAEGSILNRVLPIYQTGEKEEAFSLAKSFAADGYPDDLLYLLSREGRYREMADYIEERWPSITLFADENRGDEYGYATISSIAMAYKKLGDEVRAAEALEILDRHIQLKYEQGANNRPLSIEEARYHILMGDTDKAIALIDEVLDAGWIFPGEIAIMEPILAVLKEDSRYAVLQEKNLANINVQRAIADLPPFDNNYEPIEVEDATDSSNSSI